MKTLYSLTSSLENDLIHLFNSRIFDPQFAFEEGRMLTLSTFLLENTNTWERRSVIKILQYKLIGTLYFGFKE